MRVAVAVVFLAACGSSSEMPIDAPLPTPDAPLAPDAPPPDAPLPDAPVDAPPAIDAVPPADANTNLLSQSGLYSDFASRQTAPGYREYTPAYGLWADGLGKKRWMLLPDHTQIDTSDMNHWEFPVGTRFFKEFDAADGTPLETRLIEKTGDSTFKMGAYVWRADGSDADWTPAGATNVNGTDHDVPPQALCMQCHAGETGRILGFSAIQLSKKGGNGTLTQLEQQGLLTVAPSAAEYALPWDDVTNLGLGTLHANCGHCHNPLGSAFGPTQMILRLDVADTALADPTRSTIGTSTINVATTNFQVSQGWKRVVPGMPDMSAIYFRMSMREAGISMPPIATKHVDMTGSGYVSAWIQGLH
jgi:hypothetical protein